MRPSDELAGFVREALVAGRDRSEIGAALTEAGWADNEVHDALGAWAEGGFTPPVPRPRPYLSAREAFTYGLVFAALAMTTFFLVVLGHEIIELLLPDGAEAKGAVDYGDIRWAVSVLVVFAPTFLWLNARVHREARADPGKLRSGVRKWIGYVTLFLAVLALLGDLLAAIYAFLSGDLTLTFALKALVVAAVAGAVFAYYRAEMAEIGDA